MKAADKETLGEAAMATLSVYYRLPQEHLLVESNHYLVTGPAWCANDDSETSSVDGTVFEVGARKGYKWGYFRVLSDNVLLQPLPVSLTRWNMEAIPMLSLASQRQVFVYLGRTKSYDYPRRTEISPLWYTGPFTSGLSRFRRRDRSSCARPSGSLRPACWRTSGSQR